MAGPIQGTERPLAGSGIRGCCEHGAFPAGPASALGAVTCRSTLRATQSAQDTPGQASARQRPFTPATLPRAGPYRMTSCPPMYGRRTSGITMDPSAC